MGMGVVGWAGILYAQTFFAEIYVYRLRPGQHHDHHSAVTGLPAICYCRLAH